MRLLKRNSLRLKLGISTIGVILLTSAVLTIYNINFFKRQAEQELKSTLSSKAVAANIMIKNNLEKIEKLADNISSDNALRFSLQMSLKSQIKNFIKLSSERYTQIDNIVIFDSKGNWYSQHPIEKTRLINYIRSEMTLTNETFTGFWNLDSIQIVSASPIKVKNNASIGTVILIQSIYRQEENFKEISHELDTGVMVFHEQDLLMISCKEQHEHAAEKVYFKRNENAENNKAYFESEPEIIGEHSYYSYYTPIYDLVGNVIGSFAVTRESKFLKESITSIVKNMAVIAIGSSIFGTILIIIITTFFLSPLKKFISTLQKIGKGDYSKRVSVKRQDEIGVLALHFNEMIEKLENNIEVIENKNKRLKELDKLKDDFLANTSHELRTPLNGIIGLSESLLDGIGGSLSNKTTFNLEMITSSAKRLVNLVNDILDFAKIKNRDLEVSLKDIDIYQIVKIVTELCQPLVGSKNIKVINTIPKNFPIIYGDDARIEQILYNLIGNAIKFTAKGSITISASVNPEKDTAKFIIKDTGIGIPAHQLSSIFESFEQGDRSISRRYGGTGLGLSITKQLIELQGGEIYVVSTEGQGSSFIFTLPISDEVDQDRVFEESVIREQVKREKELKQKVEAEEKKHLSRDVLPEFTPDPKKKNILIIDDEYVNLQVLIDQLVMKKYNLDIAMSGQEALEKVEKNEYDLLILDVMMPKMSGYEVAEEIRKNHSLFQLPILMLTAKDRPEDVILGFESGANDYITKPFEKKELYARLNTLLGLKHAVDISLESTYSYLDQKERNEALKSLQNIANEFNADLDAKKILLKMRSIIKEITNYKDFQHIVKRNDHYYNFDMETQAITDIFSEELLVPREKNIYIDLMEKKKTFSQLKDAGYDLFMNKKEKNNVLVLPGIFGQDIYGIMVVELSYDLTEEQANFIYGVVFQATISLQNAKLLIRIADEIRKVEDAMFELERTQDQLIISEKMAVLGGLVAGIAHEINTPVGIGVTAASTLEETTKNIKAKYDKNKMTRTDLENYMSDADTSSKLILSNLHRASDLIRSFKQISVDQSSEDIRKFQMSEYINEILVSLHPKLKKNNHEVTVKCDENLYIKSYPGAFSQMFTNFIVNSLIHGFEDNRKHGLMTIDIEEIENRQLRIVYKDNGKGMSEEQCKKIFDPFFTTKREQGGSGLGMHIVYNIVTQKLDGKIKCISSPENGVEFLIIIPITE